MGRFIVPSVALLLLAASVGLASHGDLEKRNAKVVRRMVEDINQRDFNALNELVAPNVQRHCAATPGVEVHSLEQFKAFLRQDLVAVPDSRQEIQQLIADGDTVAVRVLYSGTQTGPMGPFPPSGRKLAIPFLGFLRLEKGKIAEIWVEWDNLAALTQLGHLPPPGAVGEASAESANKALARKWFELVINGRDLDAIPEIYAEGYVYHGPAGQELSGREQVRDFAAAILAASADRHAVVESQVAEGDRVVTRFTSRGTRTGPYHGVPPTGKEWVTEGIDISRIEGGKIVEDWEIVHSTGL